MDLLCFIPNSLRVRAFTQEAGELGSESMGRVPLLGLYVYINYMSRLT